MILKIINRWLDTNDYHNGSDVPRADLVAWIKAEFPSTDVAEAELMADGLIAAGIGREEEQTAPVQAHVTWS